MVPSAASFRSAPCVVENGSITTPFWFLNVATSASPATVTSVPLLALATPTSPT